MGIKGKLKTGLYLSGQPIPIEAANLLVYQPTIKEITLFGEQDFSTGIALLTHTNIFSEEIKKGNFDLEIYSDFQLLLIIMREDKNVKEIISKLLDFIFPTYDNIIINENSIDFYVKNEDKAIKVGVIHPFNFQFFQDTLSDLFEPEGEKEEEYNPANDAAAEIAEKLKRGRQRIKEQQSKKEGEQSIYARYISVLSVGMNIDINMFFNYTPFQLYDTFKRYFLKQSADFYQKLQSTPFMDVSKMEVPKEWTSNIYE